MDAVFPATAAVSHQDIAQVTRLLGREPRGLRAIAVRNARGEPAVIQVDSLVDHTPFPTLFWLVDKSLNLAIDKLEAGGLITQLQQQVDASAALQAALHNDHQQHIALRYQLMPAATRQQLYALGFDQVLQQRGIGGIADFQRIRCLHTYYAAHLVKPNTIGALVDAHWRRIDGSDGDGLLSLGEYNVGET
ncbi:MAG: DUF501 domain-containing protein [Cellvibrionaceae bacterium]|nr:DUF501 domain-containing protein [Cellvibrionaceae bacterium]